MKLWKNTIIGGALALATFALPVAAQSAKTGQTTLSVGVVAESSLVVGASTTTLAQLSNIGMFGDFVGATNLTYRVRIAKSGSTGAITASFAEFVGAAGNAGPTVANDLSLATSATLGTGITTSNLVVGLPGTAVTTFAANTRGSGSAVVNWTLTDDPLFETDVYTSVVTFTISNS